MRFAMIMAGGTGTRLWPMSRDDQPKQLVALIERNGRRHSLLEISASRLNGLVEPSNVLICTNERYRAPIKAALSAFGDEQILGEPVGRDTLNAVGFGAAVVAKSNPKAVMAVVTADQLIEPEDVFRQRMELGFKLVEDDPKRIITFCIKPTYAATGYGYVERGQSIAGTKGLGFVVERFVEKPDLARAQAYFESGAFGWNAGMFIWNVSTILECIKKYQPASHEGLMKIQSAWGTKDQTRVLEEVYPTLPKTSIDYGVMEHAAAEQTRGNGPVTICTVVMDVQWSDVGSWPTFAETLKADRAGNRVSGHAQIMHCKNSLVVNSEDTHHLAVLGCDDIVVVHTPDATLVMPRARAQELKELHGKLPPELK